MRRAASALSLAATLASCTCVSPPGPTLTSVEPNRVASGVDTVVAVRGSGFAPVVRADLDDPSSSEVNAGFRVEIASGAARVPLSAVTLRSGAELSAVLPAGTAPGRYDVVLVDPRGRSASLPVGLEVVECLVEGGACEDGDLCTAGDVCVSGTCVAAGEIACPSPPACKNVGTCEPATGLCSAFTPVPDDTPCNDGDPCTGQDSCHEGVCVGRLLPACAARSNTPPVACLSVSPIAGVAGATSFTLDASCSRDAEDDALKLPLAFRFDVDDGLGFLPSPSPTASATYLSPGVHTVGVEVTDSGLPEGAAAALRAYAFRDLVVVDPANVVWVTTPADESDPGATPVNWGGTGLSLREAVAYVNGLSGPTPLTDQIVAFHPEYFKGVQTVSMTSRLPVLQGAGNAVVGLPGVTVDFSGAGQPASLACMTLGGDGQRLVGLSLSGCKDTTVAIPPNRANVRISDCTLTGPGANSASRSVGVHVQSPATLVRNDVSGFYSGLTVSVGRTTVVDGNRVHANVTGISVRGADVRIVRNDVYGNAGPGLAVDNGSQVVWSNTFDGNSGDGVRAVDAVLDVRDDLFTENRGAGLNAVGCTFTPAPGTISPALGWNGYWGNAGGAVVGGAAPPGQLDVTEDPLYVSPPTADYRLLPDSPAIDAGVDLGLDLNGPSPFLFDGTAPDLGAHEYPRP